MKTNPISVLIVDDHALLRDSLKDRLEIESDLDVVGTAKDADEALDLVERLKPDVVLMDIDMPGLSCFAAAKRFIRDQPDVSILYVSAFFNDRYIDSALDAHASGYITKDEPPEVIVRAIRAAATGQTYFSPKVRSRLMIDRDGVRIVRAGKSRSSFLTPRELEVLRYIARGLPKKEIATTMHVSVKTVSRHTENLMEKLEIHDRVELARFAIREGLAEA